MHIQIQSTNWSPRGGRCEVASCVCSSLASCAVGNCSISWRSGEGLSSKSPEMRIDGEEARISTQIVRRMPLLYPNAQQ